MTIRDKKGRFIKKKKKMKFPWSKEYKAISPKKGKGKTFVKTEKPLSKKVNNEFKFARKLSLYDLHEMITAEVAHQLRVKR